MSDDPGFSLEDLLKKLSAQFPDGDEWRVIDGLTHVICWVDRSTGNEGGRH